MSWPLSQLFCPHRHSVKHEQWGLPPLYLKLSLSKSYISHAPRPTENINTGTRSHVVRGEASSGLSPGAWVTVTMATGESLVSAWRKRRPVLALTTVDVVSQCPVSAASSGTRTHDKGSRHHYKTHTMTRSICHPGHSYHFTRQLGDGDCLHISVNKSLIPLHPIS